MLKDYFDKVYLINLNSRKDRLQSATKECKKINLPFERFVGIDGYKCKLKPKPYKGQDETYWNPGALGLVITTYRLIKDAKKKGYKKILILEDDVQFSPSINKDFQKNINQVPTDWHLLQLGSQHCRKPEVVSENIVRIKFAYCLHCYGVNSEIFDYYLYLLNLKEKQLDLITAEDIQPLKKCYAFSPNLAFQKPSFSNISKQKVDYSFLKETNGMKKVIF